MNQGPPTEPSELAWICVEENSSRKSGDVAGCGSSGCSRTVLALIIKAGRIGSGGTMLWNWIERSQSTQVPELGSTLVPFIDMSIDGGGLDVAYHFCAAGCGRLATPIPVGPMEPKYYLKFGFQPPFMPNLGQKKNQANDLFFPHLDQIPIALHVSVV
jgi:hypothetical protein